MKNLLKIVSFSIFTLLLTVGSSFAQEEVKSAKSEKKCGSGCCSTKDSDSKMKKGHMDHKEVSDHHSIDKNKDGKIFECPMKCEAGKDAAGECSKCGMKLKEVSVKDSEHKHEKKEHKMMDHSKMDHSKMDHKEMSDHHSIDKNKDGKIFECPMKCEAGKDAAGECSKCGMKLKEVSVKDSEHKHEKKEHKMMDHSKMDHSKMDHKEMSDHHSIDKNKDGKIFECPMKCEAGKDAPGECSKCGMDLKEVLI